MTARQTLYFLFAMMLIAWELPRLFAPPVTHNGAAAKASSAASKSRPVSPQVARKPRPAKARATHPEFQALAKATLAELPRIEILKNRSDEAVHFAPPELLASVTAFQTIREALEKDPALAPEVAQVYRTCALDAGIFTAVRANCLFHLEETARTARIPFDRADYPPELLRLVDAIPAR